MSDRWSLHGKKGMVATMDAGRKNIWRRKEENSFDQLKTKIDFVYILLWALKSRTCFVYKPSSAPNVHKIQAAIPSLHKHTVSLCLCLSVSVSLSLFLRMSKWQSNAFANAAHNSYKCHKTSKQTPKHKCFRYATRVVCFDFDRASYIEHRQRAKKKTINLQPIARYMYNIHVCIRWICR